MMIVLTAEEQNYLLVKSDIYISEAWSHFSSVVAQVAATHANICDQCDHS